MFSINYLNIFVQKKIIIKKSQKNYGCMNHILITVSYLYSSKFSNNTQEIMRIVL